jgi:nicotinate-nucleotide pyrophosphorylase (carboxylating)
LTSRREIERIAVAALAEDGRLDITTALTVSPRIKAGGLIEYRTGGVLSGIPYADAVASACGCKIEWTAPEASSVKPGTTVGVVRGELGEILRAERPLLNFLQRASGIATTTRGFVDAVQGTRCRILHTRKTAPGLRALDIAAVVAGGGWPHRADLSHEVMVKDNHWRALANSGTGLDHALAQARQRGITALYVEVESTEQLERACSAGATRLLVDNQSPATVREWAGRARALVPGIEIEATGGITLANARTYAEAGADYISIGALTHSVQAADIALEVRFDKTELAAAHPLTRVPERR